MPSAGREARMNPAGSILKRVNRANLSPAKQLPSVSIPFEERRIFLSAKTASVAGFRHYECGFVKFSQVVWGLAIDLCEGAVFSR
jgi:hypothetical protein